MNARSTRDKPCLAAPLWATIVAASVIAVAALAAYHNSFSVPFLFDDPGWIQENPRIRHASLFKVLGGTSRPVVQLSLALNCAVSGLDARGYHAFNLIVHVLAAWTLYGIVRRTLAGERLRSRYGQTAARLAFAVALLWLLHPLQTQSVTYIIQRAESMMGLFYLLTLYCVIRGAEVANGRLWYGAAVIACALGMGSKPVMATALVIVLLYDRAFLTGSFREALRRRVWLYSGLAATWLLLPVLLENGSAEWKTSAGFAYQPIRPMEYALTQPGVIVHYLRLSVWPHPLCFDYAWPIARTPVSVVPPAALIVILLFTTVWLWKRMPPLGFLGMWFFLILAPSSSVIPIADVALEHRMYLPLAAVVALGVMGIHALVGQSRHGRMAVCLALAMGLGFLSSRRNEDYRSELAIWMDTVAKRPGNRRAHNNLGLALVNQGRFAEAIAEYTVALRIDPDDAEVHNNLGFVLAGLGKTAEAIAEYQTALRIQPNLAPAHNNLGLVLAGQGKTAEAIAEYQAALRIKPDLAPTHNNLGITLAHQGKLEEAVAEYRAALQIKPDYVEAHCNLASILAAQGKLTEAVAEYQAALRIDPHNAEARHNLGNILVDQGKLEEAVVEYRAALRIKPDDAATHNNLGLALARRGEVEEAIAEYRTALQIKPDYAEAHYNLGLALAELGKTAEAIAEYQAALRIKPDNAAAHNNLGNILARQGKLAEAVAEYQAALRIRPTNVEAHYNMGNALASQGRVAEAMAEYRETLRLKPDWPPALGKLAWILATDGNASFRNAGEAVQLAERLCAFTGYQQAEAMDVLAAACAEAGRFNDAVRVAEKAVELSNAAGQQELARQIQERLQLYLAGRPYRTGAVPAPSSR
ncbi:MAG: tetratricopeptide repeat protein [Verrucomicrobiia bacterium]